VGWFVIYSVGQLVVWYVHWSFMWSCISLGWAIVCLASLSFGRLIGWFVVWLLGCTRGWVGPRGRLDWFRKSTAHTLIQSPNGQVTASRYTHVMKPGESKYTLTLTSALEDING